MGLQVAETGDRFGHKGRRVILEKRRQYSDSVLRFGSIINDDG